MNEYNVIIDKLKSAKTKTYKNKVNDILDVFDTYEDEILEALEITNRMSWQPIETLLNDTEVILKRKDDVIVIGKKISEHMFLHYSDFGNTSFSHYFPMSYDTKSDDMPTHWMPTPTQPKGE